MSANCSTGMIGNSTNSSVNIVNVTITNLTLTRNGSEINALQFLYYSSSVLTLSFNSTVTLQNISSNMNSTTYDYNGMLALIEYSILTVSNCTSYHVASQSSSTMNTTIFGGIVAAA